VPPAGFPPVETAAARPRRPTKIQAIESAEHRRARGQRRTVRRV